MQKSDIGIMDAKAKKLWMISSTPSGLASMSREEKLYLRAAIIEAQKHAQKVMDDVTREHPFWYYQPTTGSLSPEARAFLLRHIKPEDIPQKMQGGLDMHQSTAKIRVIGGGNQSSKSYSSAVECLITATGRLPYCFDPTKEKFFKWNLSPNKTKREGPQHVRVVGFDWENDVVKNLIPKYRELAPKEFLVDGSFDKSYVAGERTLYLRDKGELLGTVEFMSNKQDLASFGGPARRMVCFDEEPFESVYKENLMRMATSHNFEVLLAYTPINGMSWTFDALREKWEAGDKSIAWFQIPSVANPKANLESLEEVVRPLDYEEKKMRILGEYVSLSGLVYGRSFQRDIHVIEPFETACNCGANGKQGVYHVETCPYEKYLHFLGVDPHMVKDSVAVDCFIDREDNFYVDTCYKKGANVDEMKADLNALIQGKRMDWAVFDPSSDSSITAFNGLNIFDLVTKGAGRLRCRSFKGDKYAGSIAAGVSTIKSRLKVNDRTGKPTYFILDRPENKPLIKSMRTLQKHHIDNPALRGQPDQILEGLEDAHAAHRYILQNKIKWKAHIAQKVESFIPDDMAALV